MKKAIRATIHKVTGARKWQFDKVKSFAENKKGLTILELGSGKKVNGKYSYSAKHLFDKENDFTCSDVVKSFGHKIIDVTKLKEKNTYDVILCLNVLEHVFDYQKSIENMHAALKKKGTLLVALPMYYPLHDEPADYWRFTEHALRKMLSDFSSVNIEYKGKREFPFCYFITATK